MPEKDIFSPEDNTKLEEEIDLFCPECNIRITTKIVTKGVDTFSNSAATPPEGVDAEFFIYEYFVCVCKHCGQPFLIRRANFEVPGGYMDLTEDEVLYPPERSTQLDGVPPSLKKRYKEAVLSFKVASYESCAMMCRKCIETMCTTLGANGRNLNDKLNNLYEAKKIDSRLLEWAQEIRLVGNDGAHEDDIVTRRDARDTLDFTEYILTYVFILTSRLDKYRNRRARRKSKL